MDSSDGRKMDAPPEGNVDTESSNEIDDEKSGSACQSLSEDMKAELRRRFFTKMKILQEQAPIQNRVVCLKNLQLEHLKIEAEFFEEVYKLEQKYQLKYQPLFDKRKAVVQGTVDPATEQPEGDCRDLEQVVKGIPGFWLTVFRTMPTISEMIRPHDEPALRKLSDISIKYADGHSYTLEFHFDKNEYFTNSVLTKQYFLKSAVDPDDPFAYEGPEMYKCTGCTIHWEKKMNLTVKTIRKKRGHQKKVPTDSFFNFFNPPEEDADDDSRLILAHDFLAAHILRSRIIPKAVLYFTGDIVDDEDDDADEDEEVSDQNEDFEYDDDEDDVPPAEDQSKPADAAKKPLPNDCPNQ